MTIYLVHGARTSLPRRYARYTRAFLAEAGAALTYRDFRSSPTYPRREPVVLGCFELRPRSAHDGRCSAVGTRRGLSVAHARSRAASRSSCRRRRLADVAGTGGMDRVGSRRAPPIEGRVLSRRRAREPLGARGGATDDLVAPRTVGGREPRARGRGSSAAAPRLPPARPVGRICDAGAHARGRGPAGRLRRRSSAPDVWQEPERVLTCSRSPRAAPSSYPSRRGYFVSPPERVSRPALARDLRRPLRAPQLATPFRRPVPADRRPRRRRARPSARAVLVDAVLMATCPRL